MKITLFKADVLGVASNTVYSKKVEIHDLNSLKEATSKDYVAATYKNNKRSNDNFIKSNCLAFDCDNDHSKKSEDWIDVPTIKQFFANVPFLVHYSKSHNKKKRSKEARPRFHILFPIDEITSASEYCVLKQRVLSEFPYFDTNAMDAARFFFGTSEAEVEMVEGEITIDKFIKQFDFAESSTSEIIEGNRNNTMSRFAARVIKKYGICEHSEDLFFKEAEKCSPPLSDNELRSIWHSAIKFGKKLASQTDYIAPEEFNAIGQYKPDNYTDIDQAKVLSKYYSNKVAFTPSTDFIVYNGSFWEESKEKAQGLAQDLTTKQLNEANLEVSKFKEELDVSGASKLIESFGEKKAIEAFNDEQLKVYLKYQKAVDYKKYALKRRNSKEIGNCLKESKPLLLVPSTIFDEDEFLLNTPTGTINLKTGEIKEADAFDFITKETTVGLSSDGENIWLEALNTIFEFDKELIDYVQKVVGLAAIGKVFVEALIISYGVGSNGKSTFWNTISRVLGSYSGSISADVLTIGCKRNVKPELAEARGKRLLIAAEMEESVRLNTSNVKQLCSTDKITAEKKYKDPFDYVPSHTLVLYTNHLPRVGALDNGTWRRLIVIPFDAKIKGTKKNYADYLFNNAGSAILKWIVEGSKKVIKLNYNIEIPSKVEEAIKSYKDNNDWFNSFLDECCVIDKDNTCKSGELYNHYRGFCARNGEFTRSTGEFYSVLESEGYHKKKLKTGTFVSGLSLKSEFLDI